MLTKDEILATLESLSVAGVASDARDLVNAVRKRSITKDLAALHDEIGKAVVGEFLRVSGVYWADDFRNRFEQTRFEVLSADLFHACALRLDGKPCVVIYRGLLHSFFYYLELMAMRSALEEVARTGELSGVLAPV
jgi:hypothetical protein